MPTTADSSAPVTSALATVLQLGDDGAFHAAIAPATDPRQAVEARINAGLPQGAPALQVRSLELHLVRAFRTADLGSGPETVVVGEPEFLYVADVGLEARVGVQVAWANGIGAGVPTFPDFTSAKRRTIVDTQPRNLIFPLIAGEWIGSIQAGTDPQAAKAAIEGFGAFDVTISGTFVEGICRRSTSRGGVSRPNAAAICPHAGTIASIHPSSFDSSIVNVVAAFCSSARGKPPQRVSVAQCRPRRSLTP